MHQSPRCGAKTRTGKPCQSPAMPNGRCRMHGGKNPGAPRGNRNALKSGQHTAEAQRFRARISDLLKDARETIELIGK
ncbi:HGGxSTG domain-containing protein [Komagataeibacter europaeus]|uniref:HGGxSTG domain-containing protein n=1 Tax=Komagataeibacter europaeus TaxID=33995 RepID=UPI0009E415C0|nr:HGGxSTG domain-containing protein [Komagataeibacter europaeus]